VTLFPDGQVHCKDGVALLSRGDVVLVVYQLAARYHRTHWLFEEIEVYTEAHPGDFMVLMVVLPTADPPDAATRAENATRLRRLGPRLRRLVTAPIGDAFRASIVRTVMRALAALQGKSGVHFVAHDVEDALERIAQGASDRTPSADQLRRDLSSLHEALGVPFKR
jgi:hypothetical protein